MTGAANLSDLVVGANNESGCCTMHHVNRRAGQALLVCVAVTLLAGLTHANASAEPQTALVNYHTAPYPVPELSVIEGDVAEKLARASALVDYNTGDFAGAYVNADANLVVVAASDRGQELAFKEFGDDAQVIFERGDLSLDAANGLSSDLYAAVPVLGEKMWKLGINPAGSGLRLGIFSALDDSDRNAVEEYAAKHSLRLDVYVDESASRPEFISRRADTSPFAGGFRYIFTYRNEEPLPSIDDKCTGGFGYRISGTDYMLTAGHCFPRTSMNEYMWNTEDGPNSPCCTPKNYIGHRAHSTFTDGTGTVRAGADNGFHGDLALVNLSVAGKAAGDYVWWGPSITTDKIPVTQRRVPTVGDRVCTDGMVTGSDCASARLRIIDTNVPMINIGGVVLINADQASSTNPDDCATNGDSGGPLVLNHQVGGDETFATAIGILSSIKRDPDKGCDQFFTGIEEAIQAWGGDIRIH